MSTKTLRKRIALVAVSALGAGLLSVVPAQAIDGHADGTVSYYGAGSTGVCKVEDSAGLVTSTITQLSTISNPLTVTAVPGAVISFAVANDYWTYSSGGQTTINTSGTLHSAYGLWDATGQASQTITANSVGTTVVTAYAGDPFTAANTLGTSTAATTPTGKLTVTVVASCANNTYSATYSGVNVAAAYDTTPQFTDGDVLTYAAGDKAYINIDAYNSYNSALPASTTWTASATNGALVKFGTDATIDDSTTSNGSYSFTTATTDGADLAVRVAPASVAGVTTTVTITADGVVLVTKTITFLPEGTKIVVTKKLSGVVGGEGAFLYEIQDAAGTKVPGSVSVVSTSLTNRVSAVTNIKAASILASDLSPAGETINAVDSGTVIGGSTSATSTSGLAKYTCSTGGGTGTTTVTLKHTTPVGAADILQTVELPCAGGVDTYAISVDKSSYKVGEIATVTITAKDSTGAAVNDFATMGASQSVSAGGGTLVKAAADADTFTAGVKTYQVQMTTAGAFNVVVNLPASGTTKSATAAYSVSDSAVSNAEVLAAIVKLIASINKQISALQKALKK